MKVKSSILFLISAAIILCTDVETMAQTGSPDLISGPGESVSLFTDRSVYVVNENICFTGIYNIFSMEMEKLMSSVLYVELISWNGSKIVQIKSSIEENKISGSLRIPADLISGNYYLRAYTKWMRNYSPYTYVYVPVKIVNPFRENTETGPKEATSVERSDELEFSGLDDALLVSGLQPNYGKRSLLELEMNVADEQYSGTYCLNIVKAGGIVDSSSSFSFITKEQSDFRQEFLPEIRGISLSGRAVEKESGNPVSGLKVNLSSSSNSFYHSSVSTDREGAFLFTFPPTVGTCEFNLSAENNVGSEYELLIDSDFCNEAIILPYRPFSLDSLEKVHIEEISRNMQISVRYQKDMAEDDSQSSLYPFYGSPTRTIFEEEFIELENVEEFLFELVYEVSIHGVEGEREITTTGLNSTLSSYPMLILLDNIVVEDLDALLKISCSKIDRIEVVKRGYVIGDYLYSGILNVYSLNKDMAGIKPPENSMFFDMSLLHSPVCSFPVYESEAEKKSRIPDLRTTIYWEPFVDLVKDSVTKVSFYTSDATGEYDLLIRKLEEVDNYIPQTIKSFIVK